MATREIVKTIKGAGGVVLAVVYSDGSIRIDNVRASYPHVGKAYKGDDAKPEDVAKFSIVGLMSKATHKPVLDYLVGVMNKILEDNNDGAKIPADKKFVRNGDDTGKPGYDGCWDIHASESKRPSVRGRRKEVLTPDEAEQTIYGGCYANILIRPWWMKNKFGKRINANLLAVQFRSEGEAFGEGRISEEDVDNTFDEQDDGQHVEDGDQNDGDADGL